MESLQKELVEAQESMSLVSNLLDNPARLSQVEAINEQLSSLVTANRSLVQAYEYRGLTHELGMEGKLRTAVHALEEELDGVSFDDLSVLMLMARRHEKDYLLRGDRKYLERVDQRLAEFEAAAAEHGIEDETRGRWGELWHAYRNSLVALADAEDEVKRYTQEANDLSASTIAAVNQFREGLEEDVAEARQSVAEVRSATDSSLVVLLGVSVALALGMTIWTVRGVVTSVRKVSERAERIAVGDLSGEAIVVKTRDEIGALGTAVNSMRDSLAELVRGISDTSTEVASMSESIASASQETSHTIREQEAQSNQVAAAVAEMTSSIEEVANNSDEVARGSVEAGEKAREGAEVVGQTVSEMREIADQVKTLSKLVDSLGDKSQQIGQIVEVINDIADQTNLLALNAAIEAARAGEHGRGFAVVADEVRKLADRTTKATAEVSESIASIQRETTQAVEEMNSSTERVTNGVGLAERAGQSLAAITSGSADVSRKIESIAAAARQQSSAAEEISRSVDAIRSATEESATGAAQSAEAATRLNQKAEELRQAVERFRLE
ncbi:MAG: methyl-accepting chemotaxis protein [Phycisphaerales bacterium JB050]